MGIKDLKPQQIWSYFDEITRVPRPSKKEGKIRAYLLDFAKKHNLAVRTDATGNVLICKSATPGCEDRPGVILQSHMDMVCEKMPVWSMISIKTLSMHILMANG